MYKRQVSWDNLQQRFATGEKVQPQLAGAHARVIVHVLGILNHAMGKHRSNWNSASPNSLLRGIRLRYIMPALLHSPDGRIKRRQRFALVESGDIVFLFPWLMAYTRRMDSGQRDAANEASEEAKLERASWTQEATEVRIGGKRGHSLPVPMANGVHETKGFGTTRCRQ